MSYNQRLMSAFEAEGRLFEPVCYVAVFCTCHCGPTGRDVLARGREAPVNAAP